MDGEWISASEALARVAKTAGITTAAMTICGRAYAGLVDARAARLVWHDRSDDDCPIPKEFWWARGERALRQNWAAGDFETWIDHKYHLLAYGVTFDRAGIEAIITAAGGFRKEADRPANPGGRQAAAWWDDLWVEICRQLYSGDLKPSRQADIASAMLKWTSDNGHEPAESTIRERARKLWKALESDAGN
jgi:hypothetical protein